MLKIKTFTLKVSLTYQHEMGELILPSENTRFRTDVQMAHAWLHSNVVLPSRHTCSPEQVLNLKLIGRCDYSSTTFGLDAMVVSSNRV